MGRPPGNRLDDAIGPVLVRADRLLRAGRITEALPLLVRAVAAAPGHAALRHDLAMAWLRTGQHRQAADGFRAALSLDPGFALSWLGLGVTLQALGDEDGALSGFQHAGWLLPSLAEAHYRAGALLESRGHRTEAETAFARAAGAAPGTSLGRLSDARALLLQGRDDAAEAVLRELLGRDPAHAAAADLLGRVLAEAGQFDEARRCYERATAAAPDLAGSYYDLVRCRRLDHGDAALIGRMRAALARPGLHPEALLKLHLALGKAADDLGDPEEAMRRFDAASATRDGLARFDLAAFEARIETIIATRFDAPDAPRPAGGPAPLLIVGLPRSGTTLVEQILSRHPDIGAGGELPFWTEQGALWDRRGGGPVPPAVAAAYRRVLEAAAGGARPRYVTDKMPLNLFWAGLAQAALPDAIVVQCRRAPIDTALSIHRTYFNQHVALPTGGADLVGAIRAAERLADHWRAVLPADRLIELEYEQLVADPEPAIRRLLHRCGLSWAPACLAPERSLRRVRTASRWQVRQPISTASVGQWRRYAPWLGPLAALRAAPPATDRGQADAIRPR